MKIRTILSTLCFSASIILILVRGVVCVISPETVVSSSVILRMHLVEYSIRFFGISFLVIALMLAITFWISFIKERKNHSRYVLAFVPMIMVIGQYFSLLCDDLNASYFLPIVGIFIVLGLSGFFLAKGYIEQSNDNG